MWDDCNMYRERLSSNKSSLAMCQFSQDIWLSDMITVQFFESNLNSCSSLFTCNWKCKERNQNHWSLLSWWWWGGGGQLLRVFGGCDWVTGHWTPLLNPGNWSFPDTSTCYICFTCICQCIPCWLNSTCHQIKEAIPTKFIFWFSEEEYIWCKWKFEHR